MLGVVVNVVVIIRNKYKVVQMFDVDVDVDTNNGNKDNNDEGKIDTGTEEKGVNTTRNNGDTVDDDDGNDNDAKKDDGDNIADRSASILLSTK